MTKKGDDFELEVDIEEELVESNVGPPVEDEADFELEIDDDEGVKDRELPKGNGKASGAALQRLFEEKNKLRDENQKLILELNKANQLRKSTEALRNELNGYRNALFTFMPFVLDAVMRAYYKTNEYDAQFQEDFVEEVKDLPSIKEAIRHGSALEDFLAVTSPNTANLMNKLTVQLNNAVEPANLYAVIRHALITLVSATRIEVEIPKEAKHKKGGKAAKKSGGFRGFKFGFK